MSSSFDFWKMLAGVAFFLLAMNFMESSLRLLAGRRFKLFLKKQTRNKIKAVAGGATVTALLQSSSISNLLVLSLVGAGVIKMENALALVLGSNLGSTFNSWLIATLGFDFNIESVVLPLAGITGIVMAFLKNETRLFLWFKFLFSLAFLFVAIGFIREGMEAFVKQTDLGQFSEYPAIVYLFLGLFLTALVQSSSVTVALTLSALYANAITLYSATAIILGAEIGTTLKFFLASAKGTAVKKRVALGNFMFNIINTFILFLLLKPVNHLITDIFSVSNNLIALVLFQSLVNLCSILLFLPFLHQLGNFLQKRYAGKEEESFFIRKVQETDNEIALEALENETRFFINDVIQYTLESHDIKELEITEGTLHKNFSNKTLKEKYAFIKQVYGEMHGFCLRLQRSEANKAGSGRLNQLIASIRNSMYAAKSISDAQDDIHQVRNSSNEVKYHFYTHSREMILDFYKPILKIFDRKNEKHTLEELTLAYRSTTEGYTKTLQLLYKESVSSHVSETEISTLINLNRELYTSLKSILFALKDYLLTADEAEYFEDLPGFIR